MRVRGAPAIGISAAYAMVMAADIAGPTVSLEEMERAGRMLRSTRPTAVNLGWAINRMLGVFGRFAGQSPDEVRDALLAEARRIHAEDIEANRLIGRNGAELLPQGARVLTICNTGALATGGYGTAFGVLRAAHEAGKLKFVYACETRPRLQGARLTAWELLQNGIQFKLLSDGAAAYLMSRGDVDAVLLPGPTASPPTATAPTRSGRTPSRWRRSTTGSRCTSSPRHRRSIRGRLPERRSRSRNVPRTRSSPRAVSASRRKGPRRGTRRST